MLLKALNCLSALAGPAPSCRELSRTTNCRKRARPPQAEILRVRRAPRKGCGSTLLTTPSLPRGDMNWFLRLVRFLREAVSEDGQGSWSRVGSATCGERSRTIVACPAWAERVEGSLPKEPALSAVEGACPERSRRVAVLLYVMITTRGLW